MRTVNMHAAKTHLSSLVEEVQKGGEIIIAKAGKPVARLVPIGADQRAPAPRASQRQDLGGARCLGP